MTLIGVRFFIFQIYEWIVNFILGGFLLDWQFYLTGSSKYLKNEWHFLLAFFTIKDLQIPKFALEKTPQT
jgi:hypothetical protein